MLTFLENLYFIFKFVENAYIYFDNKSLTILKGIYFQASEIH